MTAEAIITAARSLVGVPFLHQGRTRQGIDCAGLVVYVARQVGIEPADQAGYARTPSAGRLEAALDAQACLERVPDIAHMLAGDVLVMRFTGAAQHLGIYTGTTLIHAYERVGFVCEHHLDEAWRRRIVRVYRFKGIAP